MITMLNPIIIIFACYLAQYSNPSLTLLVWMIYRNSCYSKHITQEFLLLMLFYLASYVGGSYGLWEAVRQHPSRVWLLNRAITTDPSGSMSSLLFAETHDLLPSYRLLLSEMGLMHMWVISGYHLFSVKRFLLRFKLHQKIMQGLIFSYVIICAGSIPLMRAFLYQYITDTENRILWSWYLLLCLYPDHSTHPSLVLSVWISIWLYLRKSSKKFKSPLDFSLDAWLGMICPCAFYGIPIHPMGWLVDRMWSRWIINVLLPIMWLFLFIGPNTFLSELLEYFLLSIKVSVRWLPYASITDSSVKF